MSTNTLAIRERNAEVPSTSLTLVELLRNRARLHADRAAYIFLSDGITEETTLTWGDLDLQARAMGAWLQSLTARRERVLLLYPAGLEYITAFFGCLYAGVIAVPAYPPRQNRNLRRLHSLIIDAQPAVALTTRPILSRVINSFGKNPELAMLRWVASEDRPTAEPENWQAPEIAPTDLAFLQYTSGSTSAPKGVMLSHSNLVQNDRLIHKAFGQTEQSVIVSWLPLYHDMGLIGVVLHALSAGARCILLSPTAFLQQPFQWLQTISRYRATTSGGPNFSYDLCVRKITDEQRATLDLSSWSVAFNGAETVRAETMDRFAAAFAPCGFRREAFRPCYGLAEATLIVSARGESRAEENRPLVKHVCKTSLEQNRVIELGKKTPDARTVVTCGAPLCAREVIIANPDTLTGCAANEVGEIWVSSPSVAAGYWNNTEESARTFRAVPNGSKATYLRTGDLGFLLDGELFLTGRLKDLIITRGRNLYPQDIEGTVEQCDPSLRPGCGAAFSVTVESEERVVIVHEIEPRRTVELQSLITSVRQAISEEHEVVVYSVALVKAGMVPKTSSGKIQRKACRELFLEGGLAPIAYWLETPFGHKENLSDSLRPADSLNGAETLNWLRLQFAQVVNISAAEIDIHQPILRYGLDSLLATELTHRIESELGIAVPLTSLLESPTIEQLAASICGEAFVRDNEELVGPTPLTNTSSEYPLSFGQQSLWFQHRMAPDSAAYNLASALRLRGPLNAVALERAFASLVQRHAMLRTTFSQNSLAPRQQIHEEMPVCFEFADASSWSEAAVREYLLKEAEGPFDLSAGPLLRVNLLKRADDEHVLLVAVHHIIVDFWSLSVLMKELGVLYEAHRNGMDANLPPLQLQYTDYVRHEMEDLEGPRGKRLLEYWQQQLGGVLPLLNLQTDWPRPSLQTFRGSSQSFKVSAGLTHKLKELGRETGTTLYMVLLAAFQLLLHRYTQQKEFLIGSPVAGRNSAALASVMGYFVNPLVLRADISGDPSFIDLLARVRDTVLSALAHQDCPFALLVEHLEPTRDPSRSALFQHMFVMQQSAIAGVGGLSEQLGELAMEPIALDRHVSIFDLRLEVAQAEKTLIGSMEYNSDLFEATTIERMLGHFETLLQSIVANPEKCVSKQALLTPAENQQLLAEWNDTTVDRPDKALHQLIEAQVARTHNLVAVIFEDQKVTYAELDQRANALAAELRRRGVGPDVIVAICMERSIELVVALLGVLKAGGAYLPLDPDYPRDRLHFMIEDSRPPVLLTQKHVRHNLPNFAACQTLCVDDEVFPAAQINSEVTASNLAYVIYTSGSTGWPKGAMNTHAGIVNRLLWMQEQYELTSTDCVLQKTPFSFDVSVWEFFWPLLTGARMVLARPGGHQDPAYLAELIEREHVTTIHFVPSMLQMFLANADASRCDSLKRVICSGEALSNELQERFHARLGAELHNLYGPTEASVDVTYWKCERDARRAVVPIGRPIANLEIFLLDALGHPVPAGVVGELHIGGVGLGRGYFNRPELTAERFRPHPFSSKPGTQLYRTGDLGRYRPDGQIEFLGRVDQQVKLRGFRVELGEVEEALRAHTAVRDCVVTTAEILPGDMRLVAYVVHEGNASANSEELRRHLRVRLPEYMVPSYFVALETIPLLPNAKVDRRNLPPPSDLRLELTKEFVAPRNQIEKQLAAIWVEVLGLGQVGVDDNFFELGGHSLLAMQIVARINQLYLIDFPLRRMFETPTVAGIAQYLSAMRRADAKQEQQPSKRAPRQVDLQLSFAQERLWFLDQLDPVNSAYNMPIVLRIRGRLDLAVLERSVQEIIRRHEILRVSLTNVKGKPVQVIAPFEEWRLRVFDLFGTAKSDRWNEVIRYATKEAQRPFDLTQGPLLRAAAWQIDVNDYLLVLVMHHIVSDGWSLGVFANELKTLYKAYSDGRPSPLPDLSIHYSDFVHWQRERLASEAAAEQLDYWKRQLAGRLPALVLPGEHLRRPAPSVQVAAESCALQSQLIQRLKEFSCASGVTPFMTLLAVFQILLQRYTGLDDVLVGTPVAGRTRVETETLIGLFTNTLVLRTDLSGNPTFLELLGKVRETTLEAHAHQDVPFEMLVEVLQPERDLTRTPLFQVMIVFDPPLPEVDLPGLQLEQVELPAAAPKFDLILFLKERDGELIARFEYDTTRLDQKTVQRLARHFQTLLVNALAHAETHISDLELMTKTEAQRLRNDWNDTYKQYPREVCLHQLFEAQAARTPELVALVAGRECLSYRELNQRANRLAHHLRALGAGPESLVGVLLNRSTSLVVALLGVLKAGAAYVPLDPDYPRERLRLMIDANINVLVTQENLKYNLPPYNASVTCLDAEWGSIALESGDDPVCLNTLSQLAYLIYTSGSTGKPKAAAIEHRNVVTLMHWARELFTTIELGGVLASTSVCFDLSVFEIFVPLCWGGKVILAANALELPTLNAASEVTLINTVPSAMTELIRISGVPESVRTVNLAGEALHHSLVQRIYELEGVERVLNLYGPSEDTTYSTGATIDRCDSQAPTIGRPIANTQAYILDIHQKALPIGVAGELYVAGDGLARGYFNRPDLTAEKFIPNPFAGAPGMRMYRTGDLARYLSDGQIEFLGRSDHQVKLRGFRIELGEIETMLREHPEIRDAVVIMRQQNEDQVLVAYVVNESEQAVTPKKLKAYLSKRLPKHMVPAFIVPLAALPLTPNGKVDRRALPSLETSDEVQEDAIVLPRTDIESRLTGLWSQLLKRRQIGVHDDFFAHGGHSLLAVQLVSRIRDEFQVDLPLRSVFETATIAELARLVENASLFSSPIPKIQRSKPAPLSFAQQRLWFLDRLAPGSSAYNIFGGIRLRGELDQTAFAQSLNAIVERHEILRTAFTTVDWQPAQVVSAAQPVSLSFIDLPGATEDERETKLRTLANDELSRPFNLSDGPLLRLILLRLNEEEHVALVTMHHIVADGWSLNIFVKEFAEFYRAFHTGQPAQLATLPIQYADYAHWQRAWFDDERREIQLDYWLRTLTGTLPVLELPVDHARPSEPTLRGEKLVHKFSAELSEKLRELSRREGATLFMVLLAAFKTLLYRYTNQDDLIVGTAVAGRNRSELEGLIGIFINMLVLRTNVSGNPTFVELLRRVREVMLEAYAHQDVPFERLVEKLQPNRTLARSPFFQVAFGLQHERIQNLALPRLELSPVSFDTDLARYDLTLWVFENESELEASWTFSKDLFRPETIGLMNLRFQTLLLSVVKEPELRLSELEMHSDEERRHVAIRERESEALSVSKLLSVKRRAVRVGQ